MKTWKYTTAARIIAGCLFVLFSMATILCAIGSYALLSRNAFNDGGEELFLDAAHRLMSRDANRVLDQLSGAWSYTKQESLAAADLTLPSDLGPRHTNFRFAAYTIEKQELLNNGNPEGALAYTEGVQFVTLLPDGVKEYTQTFPTEAEAYAALEQIHAQEPWYISYSVEPSGGGFLLEAHYQPREQRQIYLCYGIEKSLPVLDRYALILPLVNALIALRNWVLPLSLLGLALALFLFVFLLSSAGHRQGQKELLTPHWLDKLPLELVILAMGLILYAAAALLQHWPEAMVLLFLPLLLTLGLLFCMTFAVRCKTKTLWKNTIARYVVQALLAALRWLWYLLKGLPLIWKALLLWGGISFMELVMMVDFARSPLVVFWLLEKLILTPLLVAFVLGLKKLQEVAGRMAAGDMTPVDTKYLFPSQKTHAQNLNRIGEGAMAAARRQMQSERMKTELITNVSHDLKTPLTSLISYVDLLKKEGLSTPRAPEYLEVLDRQSQRLKKLTEDLVEASKASSGSLPVSLEPTDVNLLLSQGMGEYAQRLEAAGLEPVITLDTSAPKIMADGRLLWRVFDNLLGNACKYALPGTRVDLSTAIDGATVRISCKNVSKAPLNISAQELMERFVRGDASRNTEGSGLGLSIAQSLAALMGGALALTIDGDLFKAEVIFPLLGEGDRVTLG